MISVLIERNIFGLMPERMFHLYFATATVVLWLLFYILAWKRNIRIIYNSSLKASWSEEIVYRGLVMGAALYFSKNSFIALSVSAVLFGFAHMKNIWWAGWGRAFQMSLYNTFITGVIFGMIRLMTGDIYIGIFVHFIHNLYVIVTTSHTKFENRFIPTDVELRAKS